MNKNDKYKFRPLLQHKNDYFFLLFFSSSLAFLLTPIISILAFSFSRDSSSLANLWSALLILACMVWMCFLYLPSVLERSSRLNCRPVVYKIRVYQYGRLCVSIQILHNHSVNCYLTVYLYVYG